MEKKEITRNCIDCGVVNCDVQDKEYPKFCLTTEHAAPELLEEALELY